ncbi:serine hydrolase FSH [Rhexocercosporidium sp. MPI-PUGE-AT-0058]|nr:serine hydrolase FSH [Rhexocercosporidium sp. MPI-PUGE-AT-0058]
MELRVLCLHGMGVDAEVFATQTAAFRSLLPASYKFSFVNASEFCDPSPGAAEYFAGPYRCWYTSPTTDNVARAHEEVRKVIDSHGPFDIVMGFSQGAALAASILMQCEIDQTPSPFKAAMFICSPLPFSITTDYGLDCRRYFGVSTSLRLQNPRPTNVPSYLIPDEYFLQGEKRNDESTGSASLTQGFAIDACKNPVFYNIFHPQIDAVRISLPTAHLYGAKDSWRRHSLDLADLCLDRLTFEHGSGHEISSDASEEICDLFEELAARVMV